MRILIAEDEAKARRYLAQGLTEQGYTVALAEDGHTALTLLREHVFDVIVLDVMLPGRDGWSIVKTMRAEGDRTPVLFLTARHHVEDRVRGFELGGDDYLVKPFAFAELLARLQSLLRRAAPTASVATIEIGELIIDALRHEVTRGGQTLQLTPKEYALLLLLARHRGRVLSRTLIAESVWGVFFETQTNVVDVVVRRLRAKLDAPFAEPLLHTVRGVGYMLDCHAH
ncbi:MAG: response regulator [Rhodanobacter sp.]|nr:MAG: response regulator [Rhodanobacter sp.]TAM42136.1 MAG: response regulator [Rhodanobacter sp.]TAN26737.1 MAG: response regulator [Rhodanobacter sp.]